MQSIEQMDKRRAADPRLPDTAQIANHVVPNGRLSVFYQGFFSYIFVIFLAQRDSTFHMVKGLSRGRGMFPIFLNNNIS